MFDALVYQIQYTLLTLLAAIFWIVNQALLFMTALCYGVKQAIIDVTAPDPQHAGFVLQVLDRMLRDASNNSIQQLVYLSLGLAVILFFGTLLVRPIVTANLVDPKRAILWLFAATMLFTLGSGFFLSLEQLREGLREMAQTVVLQSGLTTTNPDPATIHTGLPNQMGAQDHYFDNFIPCQSGPGQPCNGLDLALAYLYITQETEVTQFNGGDALHQYMPRHFCERNDAGANDPQVPLQAGYAGYFYWDMAQGDLSDNTRRQQAVNDAVQGVLRMLTAIPISLFALLEAVIYLVFTLSAAILFFSIPIALVFAFFQPTEVIVVGVMRAYLTLFVKTYAAAAILTLIFTFLLYWAQQGNAGAFLTVTLVMLVFSWQFVGMAWQTLNGSFSLVTESLNRVVGTRSSPLPTNLVAPTVTPEGRLQWGWQRAAGLRGARALVSLGTRAIRGPLAPGGGEDGRPWFGIEDPGGAVLGAAALGTGVGALATAGLAAGVGGGRRRGTEEDEGTPAGGGRRPPPRRRTGPADGRPPGPGGDPPASDGATRAGADTGDSAAASAVWAERGGWWRNEDRGRQAGHRTAQALAAPDPAAQRQGLGHLDLGAADQDRLAAAVQADPRTARAVLRAADATFQDPATASLAYLDEGGQLALGSPGMRALARQLQDDLPPEAVRRLTEEPAGQEQLGALVGARGGFERQWTTPELAAEISAAAAAPDAALVALTRQMGVAPSTFGGASPTLDHLIRELRELGVTDPETVHDLVEGAHQMHQANPQTGFGVAARQHFAAGQGPESSVAWSFIRIQEAAADRARANGEAPVRAEAAVGRLFRDALAVPSQIFTPILPRLASPAIAPAGDTGRAIPTPPPRLAGAPLAPAAPAGNGNGPAPLAADGGRARRPRGAGRAGGGSPVPLRPPPAGDAATGDGAALAPDTVLSGPPAGGRATTPLDGWGGPGGGRRRRGAPSGPSATPLMDPATGPARPPSSNGAGAVEDAPDRPADSQPGGALDPGAEILADDALTDPAPTRVGDRAELRPMLAAARATQAAEATGDSPALAGGLPVRPPAPAPSVGPAGESAGPLLANPPAPGGSRRRPRAGGRRGGASSLPAGDNVPSPPVPAPAAILQAALQAQPPGAQVLAVAAAPVADPAVQQVLVDALIQPTTDPAVRQAVAAALQPVASALQALLAPLPPVEDSDTQHLLAGLQAASRGPDEPPTTEREIS